MNKEQGMKVLHLTLKKKWFDMIASGEKLEDYREIKPYWVSRLVEGIEAPRHWETDGGFTFMVHGFPYVMESAKAFDAVEFKNGYGKNVPTIRFQIKDIVQGYGKEEWGAEFGKAYFVIKLGEIFSNISKDEMKYLEELREAEHQPLEVILQRQYKAE